MKIYAGFWERVAAFVLDYGIILVYLGAITLFSLLMNSLFSVNQWLFTDRIRAQLSGFLFITLPVSLYFAFSESSIRQATWGKQRLGLTVTDHNGNRIGFWRSVTRTGLKFIPWELAHTLIWQISFTPNQFSQLIIAGFITVYILIGANIASMIFRKDRQTLYDFIAGTYVVKHNFSGKSVMKFHYTNLETCHEATGMVIVIDVIRAFTNAAFAFSRGAKEIYPVSTVDEALKFKAETPNLLVCGEVGGMPPEGFDFGNSPTQTRLLDLNDRIIIQRTGAGTQGIVRSINGNTIFAASLVVAYATVLHIRKHTPESVSFVITGQFSEGSGDEDLACAEYLELLLKGKQPDPTPYIDRVYKSRDALFHLDPNFPAFPKSDLEHCTSIDAFDFAMPVIRENGHFVMRAAKP